MRELTKGANFAAGTYDVVCCLESGAETDTFDDGVDAVIISCLFYFGDGIDFFEIDWYAA